MAYKLNIEKNYLKYIDNSIGNNTFRNLYMINENGEEFDASEDGKKSCALFVTSILKMFNRIDNLHSTASGTLSYIKTAPNWSQTDDPKAGDLIFWEKTENTTGHVGFYIDINQAISNSAEDNHPILHQHRLKDGRSPVNYWHFNSN